MDIYIVTLIKNNRIVEQSATTDWKVAIALKEEIAEREWGDDYLIGISGGKDVWYGVVNDDSCDGHPNERVLVREVELKGASEAEEVA